MMKHYELQPMVWHEKPLIFDWDEEAGEVYGQGAEYINDMAFNNSVVDLNPGAHILSDDPLKSKEDMAAICGYWWRLPDDLAPYYPQIEEFDTDGMDPRIIEQIRY